MLKSDSWDQTGNRINVWLGIGFYQYKLREHCLHLSSILAHLCGVLFSCSKGWEVKEKHFRVVHRIPFLNHTEVLWMLCVVTMLSRNRWFSGLQQHFQHIWVFQELEPPSEEWLGPALQTWALESPPVACFQRWLVPPLPCHTPAEHFYLGDYLLLSVMERGTGCRGAWLLCDPPQEGSGKVPLGNKNTWLFPLSATREMFRMNCRRRIA